MYEITSQIYTKAAERLRDRIDDGNYFSGAIDFTVGDVECRLVASLIIYRKSVAMPEGIVEFIDDIVPVWWEFHTIVECEEQINDFDFAIFKEHML